MKQENKTLENETLEIDAAPEPDANAIDLSPEALANAIEIERLTSVVAEMTDKYKRAAAEVENTRRRAAIDAENMARVRAESVAKHFLPIIDAIHAAITHDPENEGLKTLANATASALTKIGMTAIESVGQPMNPKLHHAVSTEPAADDIPKDTIVKELQTGYLFGDAVLRPAMVVVAQ